MEDSIVFFHLVLPAEKRKKVKREDERAESKQGCLENRSGRARVYTKYSRPASAPQRQDSGEASWEQDVTQVSKVCCVEQWQFGEIKV